MNSSNFILGNIWGNKNGPAKPSRRGQDSGGAVRARNQYRSVAPESQFFPDHLVASFRPNGSWSDPRQNPFEFDTSRFESSLPSQPAESLAGDFGYSRKWRHFRRLVAKSLVSGGEFWGF